MSSELNKFEEYYSHLKQIRWSGRLYKRFFTSPLLYLCARRFGSSIVEVGSGTGSGVLGTFPKRVAGIDINPLAVEFLKSQGLDVQLITEDGSFPLVNGSFDACILDNVLEHIEAPKSTLDECWRVTKQNGGMIIVVPGMRGFISDSDHKVYYDEEKLRQLDSRWTLVSLFAMPSFFLSQRLSTSLRQYCLVGIYKKVASANA